MTGIDMFACQTCKDNHYLCEGKVPCENPLHFGYDKKARFPVHKHDWKPCPACQSPAVTRKFEGTHEEYEAAREEAEKWKRDTATFKPSVPLASTNPGGVDSWGPAKSAGVESVTGWTEDMKSLAELMDRHARHWKGYASGTVREEIILADFVALLLEAEKRGAKRVADAVEWETKRARVFHHKDMKCEIWVGVLLEAVEAAKRAEKEI